MAQQNLFWDLDTQTIFSKLRPKIKKCWNVTKKIVAPFGYYDLKTIADFAPIVLTPDEQKELFSKLTPIDPYQYLESKTDYTILIFKILNNFCDFAIEQQDISWAKLVLHEFKAYCDVFKDIRYNYYFQIAETSIPYLETKEEFWLGKNWNIAVVFESVEDTFTSEAIHNQVPTKVKNISLGINN